MEFRSTNPEGFVHYGGDVMSGAHSTRGILLSSNTVQSVSDDASEDMSILPKGSGALQLGTSSNAVTIAGTANLTGSLLSGGSTTILKIVAGQSTITVPNMPGASQDVSTVTMAGLSTGDVILSVDVRGTISTHVALTQYTVSGAAEGTITWVNCHASSISLETTGVTVRWAYLDRT